MRSDVAFACEQFQMSERQACKLVELDRSSYRYEPRSDHNAKLREELVTLARQKPRYGYRRLHALLNKRGFDASAQRVYRLYRTAGLMVRRLKRKRLTREPVASAVVRRNQEWALDFVSDALATGRALRALTVVDAFTRENLSLEVGHEFVEPSSDKGARRGDPTSGSAGGDSLRQRAGVDQPSLSELVRGTQDSAHPYSAGKADAERTYRELQRPAARRVFKRQLVS